jgi:hypothetical protein
MWRGRSRFAVQPFGLDEPGTNGRIPERASKVASGLGVIVGAPPTGSVTSGNRQPSESDVVHDHIRLRQCQIVAITCIVLRICPGHVKHAGAVGRCETVGGSSSSGEFSSVGGSAKVIGDGCPDANCKVLVKGVGQNLLPPASSPIRCFGRSHRDAHFANTPVKNFSSHSESSAHLLSNRSSPMSMNRMS